MVKKTVPKKLTFMSIYFLGINGIIGSGAFLLPQSIYKDMDLLSVVVLLSAALTVGLIALCYADLASRFTGSGAAWLYSYNAFGRFAGYELGVFTWFLGCCTYAAEVVAFLTTLKSFVPAFNQSSVYFAVGIGLVLLFSIINFFGRALVKIIPTHGASNLFFFPTQFGNNWCSRAKEAIKAGVLNEHVNATPKILNKTPMIIIT